MNAKHSKILRYIFSLIVAIVLLSYSFSDVNWEDFLRGLTECNWPMVGMSMLCGATAFLFRAFRWRRIMLPVFPQIDRLSVFNAVNIGNISNFIFQYLGEFVRTGVIVSHRKDNEKDKGYDKILGTVILERGWDLLAPAVAFAILVLCSWNDFGSFFKSEIWTPLTGRFNLQTSLILGFAFIILMALSISCFVFRNRIAIFGKICSRLKGLFCGIGSCLKMDNKWLFFLYTAIIWGMYWLMMVFMAKAFPGNTGDCIGLTDALFLMFVGSFASFVPVPGGFGAYHFLVSSALTAIYGFTKADGMLFATIAHESQALNMIILGLGSYLSELIRKDRSL